MKMHRRTIFVRGAALELADVLAGWMAKHPLLTIDEIVMLLAEQAHRVSVLMVRAGRHVERCGARADEACGNADCQPEGE